MGRITAYPWQKHRFLYYKGFNMAALDLMACRSHFLSNRAFF
jgi:hypothetical protein